MEAGALLYELISNSSTLKNTSVNILFVPSLTKFFTELDSCMFYLHFKLFLEKINNNLKCHANVYLAKSCNNIILYLSNKHGIVKQDIFFTFFSCFDLLICKQTAAHKCRNK